VQRAFLMGVTKLPTIRVDKPWGRHVLGAGFGDIPAHLPPIGEVWFQPVSENDPLLVKYLFTSENLSIQVHPDDDQGKAAGFKGGKEEAWIILSAEPDARIGLGTLQPLSSLELREALLDGSIERLMDWKPVHSGDVIYVPSGTVHAIGAGVTLVEIQQNVDVTYRLYDYGRPRELHLDLGIAAAFARPFVIDGRLEPLGAECFSLVQGQKFVVEEWKWTGKRHLFMPPGRAGLFVPLAGQGTMNEQFWYGGECWQVEGGTMVGLEPGADILFAYPGPDPLPLFDRA
jgi:mannose-6-phosphate isomerase